MKQRMIELAQKYQVFLSKNEIWATSTTGTLLQAEVGLHIHKVLSGPLGGDAQISSMVAEGKIDVVLFLRDPLTAQPHEPDITALLRICDVHAVPLATNIGTAERLLLGFTQD